MKNEKDLISRTLSSNKLFIFIFALCGAAIISLGAYLYIINDDVKAIISFLIIIFGVICVALSYYEYLKGFDEIRVTDKAVYWTNVKTGKQKILPFDQISTAVTENGNIAISSSSGTIRVVRCPDAVEVHSVISEQLSIIQTKQVVITKQPPQNTSEVEKIREYKKLLDDGIISEEEFEAKKRQLLDL